MKNKFKETVKAPQENNVKFQTKKEKTLSFG